MGQSSDQKIVIYDGDCGFCQRSVVFIARNDRSKTILFTSSLSEEGKKLITEKQILADPEKTLILIDGDQYLTQYKAVLTIAKKLKFPYKQMGYLGHLLPVFIGDRCYNFISKRRKKLIKSECSLEMKDIIESRTL